MDREAFIMSSLKNDRLSLSHAVHLNAPLSQG